MDFCALFSWLAAYKSALGNTQDKRDQLRLK